MADTIQIELSNQSCSAGLEYARRQSAGPAKDAILCCEGMCLKGETARRAANLIGHRMVPEKTVRICHGGLLEKSGGMRDLIQRANRVLILDGCGMACCSRLTKAAFPELQPEVIFTNEMTNYAGNPFGIDEVPEAEITANAHKVADALVSKYYGGCQGDRVTFMEGLMSATGCCGIGGTPELKPKMKTIRIEAQANDKYQVTVQAGERTLYVDQAVSVGGEGLGANPMEYLFASLAGCIATTARIIATQQNLDLKGMDIKVEGALDLNFLYGKSRDGRPGSTGINVSVALDSAMSELERQSFFEELRSRCPISDTIAAATPITITTI
jgi:uncharacterized OsmC-like protein/uncharacterized metal-binding protein